MIITAMTRMTITMTITEMGNDTYNNNNNDNNNNDCCQ